MPVDVPVTETEGYTRKLWEKDIIDAFGGRIKRVRVSVFYHMGLMLAAVVMILLPLIYIGMTMSVAAGIYYYATINSVVIDKIMQTPSIRTRVFLTLLYISPILIGIILLLFMFKPIFARRGIIFVTHPLEREQEPLLFRFVEEICNAIRAPIPCRIDVDCQVNASARFKHGVLSVIRGDLVLSIGLPLVTGLSMKEFAGVLAHEFGHFSQGFGMRLTYIIRSINHWFARVVYERDAWDMLLMGWSKEGDPRLSIIFYVARFFIWLTRRILWVLMMIGHIFSCFLLREMEYDADQYAVRLIGSKKAESMLRKTQYLAVATEGVHYDLEQSWKERRLGDDFSTLVAEKVKEIPPELQKRIEDQISSGKTQWFSTHPSLRSRIKKIQKQADSAIFTMEAPATDLFSKYHQTAKIASLMYYHAILGPQVNPANLASTEDLTQRRKQVSEEQIAQSRYFQNVWTSAYPFIVDDVTIEPPENPLETARTLVSVRKRMRSNLPHIHNAFHRYEEAFNDMCKAARALALFEAGIKIAPHEFGYSSWTKEAIQHADNEARKNMNNLKVELDEFSRDARTRLVCALQLLHNEKVKSQMNDRYVEPSEAKELYRIIARLCFGMEFVTELNMNFIVLDVLLRIFQDNQDNEKLKHKILSILSICHRHMKTIYSTFSINPYPFDHASGNVSIGSYIVGALPLQPQSGEVISKTQDTIENYWTLYFRIISRLAFIAEHVETALGLKSWPEPKYDDTGRAIVEPETQE